MLLCIFFVFFSAQAVVERAFVGNGEQKADCAIVFGAAVVGARLPGSAIIRRITKAVQLLQAGNVRKLVLSGGHGEGQPLSESEVMREQAHAQGVDDHLMLLESASRSTWENIAFSRPLLAQCSSVLAVSDRYHLARIRMIAYRQGWGSLAAVPATTGETSPTEGESELREILGILYYGFFADFFVDHAALPRWIIS